MPIKIADFIKLLLNELFKPGNKSSLNKIQSNHLKKKLILVFSKCSLKQLTQAIVSI